MRPLVWTIEGKYGWANKPVDNSKSGKFIPYDLCHVVQQDNGLWTGGFTFAGAGHYTPFPGEHPLEELQAILETTVALLSGEK